MDKVTPVEILLPELRAYARSISSFPDEAEDLVQDAVLRSLKSGDCPSRVADLRPWMFRVIRNLYYDELRKMRVRREYAAGQSRWYSGVGQISGPERDILFRMAYEKLPADKREVLFLVDIIGMRYDEAAEVMSVPRGTVMSRLSRARQALRDLVVAPETAHADAKHGERKA